MQYGNIERSETCQGVCVVATAVCVPSVPTPVSACLITSVLTQVSYILLISLSPLSCRDHVMLLSRSVKVVEYQSVIVANTVGLVFF